jgi:ferredoxin-NADP reductase
MQATSSTGQNEVLTCPAGAALRLQAFRAVRLGLAVAFVFLFAVDGQAQTPDGHTEHHPSAPAPTTPPTAPQDHAPKPPPAPAAPQPGMMMPGMDGMMGHRPPKPFYPSLMDFPTLSAEERKSFEAKAQARFSAGLAEVAAAEDELRHAHAAKDAAAAERAARRLRDGLNDVSSGAAARRALAEGRPGPQIARDWFRQQMNLPPDSVHPPSSGLFGLDWIHVAAMAALLAVSLLLMVAYVARTRRAAALADRLVQASATAGATPATAKVESVPTPAAAPMTLPTVPTTRPEAAKLWKGQLRVAAIFTETPNVRTYRFREISGGPIPFSFYPGQFMTLSAGIGGKLVRRSYTIASSAAQTSYVETTIKREDAGVFSEHMHRSVSEGDVLDVMAPSGAFTFTGAESDSVVLIGGGVGITPLMAAVRYLCDIAWPGEIFLVYGARTTEDFIFRDELEHLQRRHAKLHVVASMVRAAGTSWMGPEGPISKALLADTVPGIASRRVHLCGPPGMMAAIRAVLADLGVPAASIKTEAFGPARGAVPPPGQTLVVEPADKALADQPVRPAEPIAAIGPATATIRFAISNKTAPLTPDQSVLEAAESIGVPIDYACRVGTCGTCKTRLLEGSVTMEIDEALTPEEKSGNIILACQAKSIGNLVVQA